MTPLSAVWDQSLGQSKGKVLYPFALVSSLKAKLFTQSYEVSLKCQILLNGFIFLCVVFRLET
jgi:hypothetical protein